MLIVIINLLSFSNWSSNQFLDGINHSVFILQALSFVLMKNDFSGA